METTSLSFAQVLPQLLEGNVRVAREGWNAKNQWVCFMPAMIVPAEHVNTRTRKFVPSGPLNCGAYLVLKTAKDVWQPGWVPSQGDLTATDWYVLKD